MKVITGIDPCDGQAYRLEIADGRIASVAQVAAGPDLPFLTEGLVDLQVNGWGGHDLNGADVTVATVLAIAEGLRAGGVRAFLPTLITGPQAQILATLQVISAARAAHPWLSAMIPGVHMEGPFISARDGARGAHPLAHVRAPSVAEVGQWQQASGGLVRMITLCPAWEGAPEFIKAATAAGIIISLGHSHAEPAQIHAAVAAGARTSTHLGNGLAATLPRHPNLVWSQLASPLQAMFIADGHHLDRDTLCAMLRAKGTGQAILVSDMVALSGLPAGLYDQPIGGQVSLSDDGRLSVAGTPYLAGAVKPLADGVAHVAGLYGFDLAQALTMASRNPADLLGLATGFAKGQAAPFVFGFETGDETLSFHTIEAMPCDNFPKQAG